MMIHEILILIIATLGCILIPVGYDIAQHSRRTHSTVFHGVICIIYGTLCALVAVAGYINLWLY